MKPALQFCKLDPSYADPLGDFLESLAGSSDAQLFHPHPLTRQAAHDVCRYQGYDLYVVAVCGLEILAYGLLRGWDEGYAIPSLGIAVARPHRGTGIARAFMLYLHAAAQLRGATRVRLSVWRRNTRAIALYQSLGYLFQPKNDDEEIGLLDLKQGSA